MDTLFTLIGLIVVILFLISLIFNRGMDKEGVEKLVRITAEKAYFDGQKDVLNNKVFIEKQSEDSEYQWKENVLPDGFDQKPTYNPNKDFEEQILELFGKFKEDLK